MKTSRFPLLLFLALCIAILGILSIYSTMHSRQVFNWQSVYVRQFLWVILGVACFILASNLSYRLLWDAAYFLYFAALFLLLLVCILGVIRLGAQRWLKFAWFNFQPAEIVKPIIVIFLARYFSTKSVAGVTLAAPGFGIRQALIIPFIFVAIPAGMIIEQPDLGSAIMIILIFAVMLYLAQIKFRYLVIFVLVMVLFLPLSWNFLRDYQRERLLVFLNPNIDPLGAGYTVIQSKIAIGSGGLFGRGWLSGTQGQLRFLPESHTDFIFASFCEERGLLGCWVLLLLYYLLIRRSLEIALKSNDHFARLVGLGISLMLFMQIFVNITMNLGLAPVVGLPLPLLSYGGSSVIATFISLGILDNIEKTRAVF